MFLPWLTLIIEGIITRPFSSSISENDFLFCSIVITINAFVLILSVYKIPTNKKLKNILVLGVLFRLFLLFWDLNLSNVYMLPNSGKDTVMFANAARSGYMTGDYHRGGLYSQYISLVYRFFGVQRPIAQYTNILFAITMIYFVFLTMEYLDISSRTQTIVLELFCLLPNTAIINSILLRETMIAFLISFSLYFFIRWISENNIVYLVFFVISALISTMIHSGSIALLVAEAVFIILYDRSSKQLKLNIGSLFWIITIIIGSFAIFSQFGAELLYKFQGVDSIDDVVNGVDKHISGGSAYSAGFKVNNSLVSLIINTPIRMFYFLFSPLPWNWRNLSDIIAFCFSSVLFLYALYRSLKELKIGAEQKYKVWLCMLVIVGLIAAMVFAWGVSNSGTAVRHREKFISVFVLMIAVANESRRRRLLSKVS